MSNIIKEAKQLHYNKQIINSINNIKTTWKTVNLETCRKASNTATETLSTLGFIINNQQHTAATFNN